MSKTWQVGWREGVAIFLTSFINNFTCNTYILSRGGLTAILLSKSQGRGAGGGAVPLNHLEGGRTCPWLKIVIHCSKCRITRSSLKSIIRQIGLPELTVDYHFSQGSRFFFLYNDRVIKTGGGGVGPAIKNMVLTASMHERGGGKTSLARLFEK